MLWFTNLKTANKLLVFFAAMLAFLVVTAAMGASAARTMKEEQRATYERDLRSIAYLERLTGQRLRIARSVRDGIIEVDTARMAAHARETASLEQSLRRSFADLEKEVGDPAVHAVVRALAADFDAYMAKARDAVAASPSATSKGDYPKMMAALDETTGIGRKSDAAIAAQVERLTAEAATRAANAEALYRRDLAFSAGLFVLVVLFGSVCTAVISRAIATPLKSAVGVLEKVAEGDLTAELEAERRDEIGQMARALNRSIAAMRATLVDVTEISREVALASGELASSAQTISSGAQEQASSLEETAASLEEISVVVKQNTESTQRVADVTAGARDSAGRGGSIVESAVTAMEDITRSSKQVADIISTIDEIAFQTNLLALNAAVEAARAGEQGRGFAVVATEVRMLAQRTGGAAREIRGLIAESSAKVEAGTRQVNESGRTLADLVGAVRTVTDMVGEIAAASREQTASVDQVAYSVSQVDQVTQRNAAQTEELSATATSLAEKAAHLQRLVAAFHLGDAAPAGPARLATVRRLPQRPAASTGARGVARAANG